MTRKAIKPSNTALVNAVSSLKSIKADLSFTQGRELISTGDRMAVIPMPIEKFLPFIKDVSPIDVQRNDLYRLTNNLAKHLDTFELPQALVSVVYLDGTFYMVDGNTRKRHWLSASRSELPSHVFVAVMTVSSKDEGKVIYGCYDSSAAKKTNRDELISMMRTAGVDPESLKSSLVAGGMLVSVVRNVARVQYCGSSTTQRKQEVASYHAKAFMDLDRLALKSKDIPGGGVWALMRLYAELPRDFVEYIDQYGAELRKLGTPEDGLAAAPARLARDKAIKYCHTLHLGTSGEKPMPPMFLAYLEGFRNYALELRRLNRASSSFAKYLPTLKKFIEQEIAQVKLRIPAISSLV